MFFEPTQSQEKLPDAGRILAQASFRDPRIRPRVGVMVKQAEDELSVINMVIGAGLAGVRSMCGASGGGFAPIDVFSPCVTWNKVNTYAWFRERVYDVYEEGHDPASFEAAMAKALEFGDRIPTGLIYQSDRPTYEESEPVLQRGPLVKQALGIQQPLFDELLAELMQVSLFS